MQRPQTGLVVRLYDDKSISSLQHAKLAYESELERFENGLGKLQAFYAEWLQTKGYKPTALEKDIAKHEERINQCNAELAYINYCINELQPQPEPTKPVGEVEESDNFGM